MKKIHLSVAVVLLAGTVLCSSCVGSYTLFNKYNHWQLHMTDNKYINGIVGFLISPFVGGIAYFIDHVILNTIEFWSGSNPAGGLSQTTTVKGQDGRYYAITVTKMGYEIKSPTGEVTYLMHNEQEDSWSIVQNGRVKELFRYKADGTIEAKMQNGQTINVTNDEAGLNQVRESIMGDQRFFASR
jgi:hypothetical protein